MRHSFNRRRIFCFSFTALTLIFVVTPALGASAYNPKSLQHSLFNLPGFVRVRRNARADRLNKTVHYNPPVVPSSSSSSSASSVPSVENTKELRIEDLSTTEREALRKQLRIRACPEDAHPGYRKLCESLLKLQKPGETRQGTLSDKLAQ